MKLSFNEDTDDPISMQDVYEPGKWNCSTRVAQWSEPLSRVWEVIVSNL